MIAWWPGDTTNVTDIFSTNNGALFDGAQSGVPGYDGGAFVFNGTNYAAIPDSLALHPANLTIETWARCDFLDTPSINSYPGQQYIIFHQNAQVDNFEGFDLAKDRRPLYIATNDTWCFEVTSVEGNNVFIESQVYVHTNEWHHLAGVRGSNYIQLYVDGVLQGETNVDFPVGYGNEPLYFATTGQSYYDHKFGGALDEIGFYNRALSSNEIYAIYAAGHSGKCKTPSMISMGLTPPQPTNVYPQMGIGGLAGQTYSIQGASTAIGPTNRWTTLTNLTLPANSDIWTDPTPATNAQRFYRIVSTNSSP